jgi:magnesium-transporting ATPase (P-type)
MKQYEYIYELEKCLGQYFDNRAFIREGNFYKKYKLMFSSWTKFIFWNLFPVMLTAFIVFWLVFLFTKSNAPIGYQIIDSLISLSILISEGLYLWALYKKK